MTHPLVGFFWDVFLRKWKHASVFFLSLPYTTHSLFFSCLDTDVRLCGTSLCQATHAAWSSGSCRQPESKRSDGGVISCLLLSPAWQNWEGWKHPWDGQRLKWEWGREMKESTVLTKEMPRGVKAKWWQPSAGWLLVEDHQAHPTPCKTMRNWNKEVKLCLRSLGSSCFITHFLVVPCLPDGTLHTKSRQLRRASKSLMPWKSPWGKIEEHSQRLGSLLNPLEQGSKRNGAIRRTTPWKHYDLMSSSDQLSWRIREVTKLINQYP